MKLQNLKLTLQALTGRDETTADCVSVFERNEWDASTGKYDKNKLLGYTYRCRANCNQQGQEDFFDVKVDGTDKKDVEEIMQKIKEHGKAEVDFTDLTATPYSFLGVDGKLIAGVSVKASKVTCEEEIVL